jgi:hypothetical protein
MESYSPFELGLTNDPEQTWKQCRIHAPEAVDFSRRRLAFRFCDAWVELYGYRPGPKALRIFLCGPQPGDYEKLKKVECAVYEADLELLWCDGRLHELKCQGVDGDVVRLSALLDEYAWVSIKNLYRDWSRYRNRHRKRFIICNSEITDAILADPLSFSEDNRHDNDRLASSIEARAYSWLVASDPRIDSRLLWALLRSVTCGYRQCGHKNIPVTGAQLIRWLSRWDARQQKYMTQQDLADRFGVNVDSIGRWLRRVKSEMREYLPTVKELILPGNHHVT